MRGDNGALMFKFFETRIRPTAPPPGDRAPVDVKSEVQAALESAARNEPQSAKAA